MIWYDTMWDIIVLVFFEFNERDLACSCSIWIYAGPISARRIYMIWRISGIFSYLCFCVHMWTKCDYQYSSRSTRIGRSTFNVRLPMSGTISVLKIDRTFLNVTEHFTKWYLETLRNWFNNCVPVEVVSRQNLWSSKSDAMFGEVILENNHTSKRTVLRRKLGYRLLYRQPATDYGLHRLHG